MENTYIFASETKKPVRLLGLKIKTDFQNDYTKPNQQSNRKID